MPNQTCRLAYRNCVSQAYPHLQFRRARCHGIENAQTSIAYKTILCEPIQRTYVGGTCNGEAVWKERRPCYIVSSIARRRKLLCSGSRARSLHSQKKSGDAQSTQGRTPSPAFFGSEGQIAFCLSLTKFCGFLAQADCGLHVHALLEGQGGQYVSTV